MQDKEEMIGKLKEEIDLLNRVSIHIFQFHGFLFLAIGWQYVNMKKLILFSSFVNAVVIYGS